MASNAPRQLLRGASCHAPPSRPLASPSSCRPLPRANPYTHLPIRSYNSRPKQRMPPAPPPPERSAYAQKAEERALLSKLSTLSPDQITALLSAQPETAAPPPPPSGPTYAHAPGGSGGKTWRQRLQPVFFALAALVLGNLLGQKVIHDNEALSALDQFEEEGREGGDKVHTGEERSLSVFVNLAMRGSGPELLGLPNYGVYSVNPAGLTTYMYSGWIKPGVLSDMKGRNLLIQPDEASVVPEGVFRGEGKVVTWPAHMRLLERTDMANEFAARKKQHLVAGAYGSASTLGGIYQIVQDPDTNALSVILTFGERMAGPIGIVHSGAIATVLDESMGRLAMRTLPSKTAVTAKLVLRYSADRLQPSVEGLYRIELDVLTKEAARDLENNLRIDATYEMAADGRVGHFSSKGPAQTSSSTGQAKPPPKLVELDQVQTDKKVWIRARMYGVAQPELVCEAKGLFVVPKDVELEQLGEHW